MTIVDLSVC